MTQDEQLKLWLEGKPVHTTANRKEGVCCPDFSCCNPGMLWPEEKRREFVNGDEKTRYRMCMAALGALMDYHEKRRVRIAGDEE